LVFLPLGVPTGAASRQPRSETALLDEVRAAATHLVRELKHAEEATAGWSDRELSEILVDAALSECLAQLASTGCWGETNRIPSSELWRIAGPVLEVGSLQHHARFKPYGYAGDHVMLARICERSVCDHTLGSVFDRYFLRQAAPEAVRARTEHVAASLVSHRLAHAGGEYQAVSVGAGPALDISQAVAALPREFRATLGVRLLDLDPDALDAAGKRLEPQLPVDRVTCTRTNLHRLAKGARGADELGTANFLVCSGFFDYLDDPTATALLGLFWRQLAPGGLLLVGNFAPHNPSRAYMEWIGNWYLKYRTPEELERLAVQAAIPRDRFRLGCERTGVDLFLVVTKSC
jgi:extracellular factor (EF) 3-hydroxypalmitic acid methyl ester biosynthesis protein